jgi:hypothetical protein
VRYADRNTTIHLGAGQSLRLHPEDFRQAAADTPENHV